MDKEEKVDIEENEKTLKRTKRRIDKGKRRT